MSEAAPEASHEADLVTELQCDHVLPQGGGDLPLPPYFGVFTPSIFFKFY